MSKYCSHGKELMIQNDENTAMSSLMRLRLKQGKAKKITTDFSFDIVLTVATDPLD